MVFSIGTGISINRKGKTKYGGKYSKDIYEEGFNRANKNPAEVFWDIFRGLIPELPEWVITWWYTSILEEELSMEVKGIILPIKYYAIWDSWRDWVESLEFLESLSQVFSMQNRDYERDVKICSLFASIIGAFEICLALIVLLLGK